MSESCRDGRVYRPTADTPDTRPTTILSSSPRSSLVYFADHKFFPRCSGAVHLASFRSTSTTLQQSYLFHHHPSYPGSYHGASRVSLHSPTADRVAQQRTRACHQPQLGEALQSRPPQRMEPYKSIRCRRADLCTSWVMVLHIPSASSHCWRRSDRDGVSCGISHTALRQLPLCTLPQRRETQFEIGRDSPKLRGIDLPAVSRLAMRAQRPSRRGKRAPRSRYSEVSTVWSLL